jgi:myo-inositol-1(or 4)-monophosphatase
MINTSDFITNLAQQTGQLLLQKFKLFGTDVSLKSDRTVVTEADIAADHFITQEIMKYYPGEAILSEELHPEIEQTDSPIWIIDPLDGSANYSLGLPIWGVSIVRLVNGWPETAAVFFPAVGELYSSTRGNGAFLNGQPIEVKPLRPDQPASFFSCCSRTHRLYQVDLRYKTRILGSACYSWCALARGMAIISFEATPKIWDIASGWLIIKEAHGDIQLYDGSSPFPITAGVNYSQLNLATIAAASPELLTKAKAQIRLK